MYGSSETRDELMKRLPTAFCMAALCVASLPFLPFAVASNPTRASRPAVAPQTKSNEPACAVDTAFLSRLWAVKRTFQQGVRRTIHVNVGAVDASDANPGTSDAPLKTLAAALKRAQPGTRILLHPGRYPESVTLGRAQSGTALEPVIIEAEKPGTAILTGSDVWTDWMPVGMAGNYSHPWPYKWGVAPDPFVDAGASLGPLGRRAEMVFVNDKSFRQVLERAALAPGTFWVSEADGQITLRMPPGENPERDHIEVAVRKSAIEMGSVWGKLSDSHDWPSYYVLRGLSVEHYTGQGDFGRAAATACGAHFLIEDCRFTWNDATALTLRGSDIVVRRCVCDHNGSSGIGSPPTPFPSIQNVLMEDDQTENNNWRGAMGDFYGYAVAGMKLMTSGSIVLRRFTSAHNASPGVWLDKDNRNYLIDHCRFVDNTKGPGLWLEISPGPFLVRDCISAFNGDGVMISNSAEITLLRNTLYGNTGSQIAEWSPALDRESCYDLSLALYDNVIVGANGGEALWRRPNYPNIYSTLRAGGNLWYRPGGGGWFLGTEALDFSGWLTRTQQDATSVWADPRLQTPNLGNFAPRADSPLVHRGEWGTRAAVILLPQRALVTPDTKVYMATESGLPIRYTLDGTSPGPASRVYTGPIPLEHAATVKAQVFGPNTWDAPIATATLIGVAPPVPDVFVSDLTPIKNVVGWGGQARKDRSIQDAALRIDGIGFAHGMGAHAPSEIIYDIPKDAHRFVSIVGVDDEVLGQANGKSSVTFAVYADDMLLTQTGVLHVGDLRSIDVKIPTDSHRIHLVVTDGGNGQDWDHADWAQAGFLKS